LQQASHAFLLHSLCFIRFASFALLPMLNFEVNLVSVWQVCDTNRNLLANILELPSIFQMLIYLDCLAMHE
jgi:hypothetical protein